MEEKRTTRADREAVAEILAQHYAIGSINDDELSERLDAAMSAKFPSELHRLLGDLSCLPDQASPPMPQLVPYGPPQPRQPVTRAPYRPRRHPSIWAVQNTLAVVIPLVFIPALG